MGVVRISSGMGQYGLQMSRERVNSSLNNPIPGSGPIRVGRDCFKISSSFAAARASLYRL